MSVGQYIKTRITSLKPLNHRAVNPIRVLKQLTGMNWLMFLCSFLAWSWDAFDFFTVSLCVTDLAKDLHKSKTDITWGITLVLMFRSVGAIAFGLASDRYGRKWPFIANCILFIAFELGTGFVQTYPQFLAVRACFGIAMGGLYGNVAATALEDCPPEARGIISGMLQQGYAFGYLLAVVFARGLVDTTNHGWRPLFWFGACPPVLLIIFRFFLPETNAFLKRQAVRESGDGIEKVFFREGKIAVRRHWKTLLYMVCLMAGFNFMSHGSQDLYPTMLTNELQFSANKVTVTQVVANLGAITGGTVIGYCSGIFGRRIMIILMCLLGGALVYPYGFVKSDGIIGVAFWEQFAVQGAWGVIPIHLMELSPPAFRTFVVGTAYQLGNLASSASSTIESKLGENYPLPKTRSGVSRYDYGKVICIFMGAVFAYVLVVTLAGPEYKDRDLDDNEETALAVGGKAHGHDSDHDVYEEKSTVQDIEHVGSARGGIEDRKTNV